MQTRKTILEANSPFFAILTIRYNALVGLKCLHTPVKMAGFCKVKQKYIKINRVGTFHTLNVKLQSLQIR